MLNRCPDCDAPLGASAIACRCGWRNGAKHMVPQIIPCAHETCGESAMCKIKVPTGWANLCLTHYEAHYREEGRKAMERHGLIRKPNETREFFAKHVRQYWKDLAASSSISKRWEDAA